MASFANSSNNFGNERQRHLVLFPFKFVSLNLTLAAKYIFFVYREVASSNMSRLEAHASFFRLLINWIFDPYVLWRFDKKLIS